MKLSTIFALIFLFISVSVALAQADCIIRSPFTPVARVDSVYHRMSVDSSALTDQIEFPLQVPNLDGVYNLVLTSSGSGNDYGTVEVEAYISQGDGNYFYYRIASGIVRDFVSSPLTVSLPPAIVQSLRVTLRAGDACSSTSPCGYAIDAAVAISTSAGCSVTPTPTPTATWPTLAPTSTATPTPTATASATPTVTGTPPTPTPPPACNAQYDFTTGLDGWRGDILPPEYRSTNAPLGWYQGSWGYTAGGTLPYNAVWRTPSAWGTYYLYKTYADLVSDLGTSFNYQDLRVSFRANGSYTGGGDYTRIFYVYTDGTYDVWDTLGFSGGVGGDAAWSNHTNINTFIPQGAKTLSRVYVVIGTGGSNYAYVDHIRITAPCIPPTPTPTVTGTPPTATPSGTPPTATPTPRGTTIPLPWPRATATAWTNNNATATAQSNQNATSTAQAVATATAQGTPITATPSRPGTDLGDGDGGVVSPDPVGGGVCVPQDMSPTTPLCDGWWCPLAGYLTPFYYGYDMGRSLYYSGGYASCKMQLVSSGLSTFGSSVLTSVDTVSDLMLSPASGSVTIGVCSSSSLTSGVASFISTSFYFRAVWYVVLALLSVKLAVSGVKMLVSLKFNSPMQEGDS